MNLTDALFLTTLVAIVFFFIGWSFAQWRIQDRQKAPAIKVPRGHVFIGTTNEADYAAPSNDRTSRATYSKSFHSCSCNAVLKDDCHCESKRSYTPSASSGVALSSNTD